MPPANPSTSRSYTKAHAAAAARVIACAGNAHYNVLDVGEDADEDTIKRAYKKLAMVLHPDKNGAPGAEDAFKRVSTAHSVLTNSRTKAQYDAERSAKVYGFFQPMFDDDEFEYDEPKQPGKAGQARKGGESRKTRRKKQYSDRQRAKKENAEQKEFDRVWKEYETNMRSQGLAVYACFDCSTVHAVPLADDQGAAYAHNLARSTQNSSDRPSPSSWDELPELLWAMGRVALGTFYLGYFTTKATGSRTAGTFVALAGLTGSIFANPPFGPVIATVLLTSGITGSLYTLYRILFWLPWPLSLIAASSERTVFAVGLGLFMYADGWRLGQPSRNWITLGTCYGVLSFLYGFWLRAGYGVISLAQLALMDDPPVVPAAAGLVALGLAWKGVQVGCRTAWKYGWPGVTTVGVAGSLLIELARRSKGVRRFSRALWRDLVVGKPKSEEYDYHAK
ncbi:hypothetical protein BKA62DRAFT_775023 [Auriculariales sp. MPI-PUGE-AT-0066]|nr:hypothetical protein BKA62DRAFT_775023 [Auriculariales sp. MPI-PUGE-AT-0066]